MSMKPKAILPFAIIALLCLAVYVGCSGDDNGGTKPPEKYTLTVTVVGEGSVIRAPDAAEFVSGSLVELTADPDSGYEFDGWSGDLEGIVNPDTIKMTEDKAVTATFAEVLPVTVTGTIALAEGGDLVSPIAFLDSSHSGRIVIFRNAGWLADPETGEFTIQFDLEELDSLDAIVTAFDDLNENLEVDSTEPIGWWDVDGDSIWDDPDDFVTFRPGGTVSGAEVILYPASSQSPSARKQPSGVIRLR